LAQRGLDPILDVNNPHIEKARTPFDTTHAFKLNHSIPIPFGEGHRLHTTKLIDRIVGGWTYSGFLRIESGPPVSILSARGTLNRGLALGQNTVGHESLARSVEGDHRAVHDRQRTVFRKPRQR